MHQSDDIEFESTSLIYQSTEVKSCVKFLLKKYVVHDKIRKIYTFSIKVLSLTQTQAVNRALHPIAIILLNIPHTKYGVYQNMIQRDITKIIRNTNITVA